MATLLQAEKLSIVGKSKLQKQTVPRQTGDMLLHGFDLTVLRGCWQDVGRPGSLAV